MTEEKRTPAAWAKNCLAMLQDINPSYRKNRDVKGRFIEFIREDDSGLVISHNFIKIRKDYHYQFALTFLTRPTELLTHCMVCGSRFDHNRTIWRQFLDDAGVFRGDPGCPTGIWSFGPWRDNTMENLRKGLVIPEEHLLPFYRRALSDGKETLVRLFQTAQRIVDSIRPGADLDSVAGYIEREVAQTQQFRRECFGLDGFKLARGGECKYGYGPPEPGFLVENVPGEAIVVSQLAVFLQERDRLNDIISIARKL